MSESCCCTCENPRHSRESYGETCVKCGKHRPPRGTIRWATDDTPPESPERVKGKAWLVDDGWEFASDVEDCEGCTDATLVLHDRPAERDGCRICAGGDLDGALERCPRCERELPSPERGEGEVPPRPVRKHTPGSPGMVKQPEGPTVTPDPVYRIKTPPATPPTPRG